MQSQDKSEPRRTAEEFSVRNLSVRKKKERTECAPENKLRIEPSYVFSRGHLQRPKSNT